MIKDKKLISRIYMYIFILLSYVVWFWIISANANLELEKIRYNPDLIHDTIFVNLVVNR